MVRVLEWNINGRSRGNVKACNFIYENLIKSSPDIIILTEYVSANCKDLEQKLKNRGFDLINTENSILTVNGILIAYKNKIFDKIKNHLSVESLEKENHPNYLEVSLREIKSNKRIAVVGTRIKIGGQDLNEDFKNRRNQIGFLIRHLEKIENEQVILLGDFNNGYFSAEDNADSYVGKPREYYNYPYIVDVMKNVGFTVTTPKDFSWKKGFRLDHVFSKNCSILRAIYDWNFVNDLSYQHAVGYPDHAQLIADLDFEEEQ